LKQHFVSSPENIDYSEQLLAWSIRQSVNIGPMIKKSMENAKIEDLELRFGYPYVYVHQVI